MQHKRNPIKTAIAVAGGRGPASEALKSDPATLSRWVKLGRMPADKIGPLCRLGDNRVKPEEILDFCEANASQAEKAAA